MAITAVTPPSGARGRREIVGALLLNLAVSPLFIWSVVSDPLAQELAVSPARASLVFSLELAAFAPSLGLVILGFGVKQGVAVGLGYATAGHVVGMVNRGLVMALAVSAYGAGSAALAPLAHWLLGAHGRAPALLSIAALAGLLALAAAIMLPKRPPRAAPAPRHAPPPVANGRILVIGLLWLTFGLGSAPGLAAFAFVGDFTGGTAAAAVAALSLGNFGGRLLAGWVADRLGVARGLHLFCLLLTAACLALIFDPHRWVSLVALCAVGAQYGALSTLVPLATRAAVSPEIFGRVFGVVFSAWGVFGLGAPAVVAMLLAAGSVPFAAGGMLGCALLAWLAAIALVAQLSAHCSPSPETKKGRDPG